MNEFDLFDFDGDFSDGYDYDSYHGELVDEYDDECFIYLVYADGHEKRYAKDEE